MGVLVGHGVQDVLEFVKGGGISASEELHVELRVAPGCFVEPARGTATRVLTVKLGLL